MLRVSTRARYALRMMLDVARHGGEHQPVSLGTVSKRTDISRGYLEQVAHALRSARLLRAVSGRRGGYRLAGPPEQITVGQVFEALIGPTCIIDCLEDPHSCPRSAGCECRTVYGLINRSIVQVLRGHTLADLLDPAWNRRYGNDGIPIAESPEGFGCNPNKSGSGKRC